MSTIGYGHGSEWHLLRYLGYQRGRLNRAILGGIGADSPSNIGTAGGGRDVVRGEIDWIDFIPAPSPAWRPGSWHKLIKVRDREHEGLDFLRDEPDGDGILRDYAEFWPQRGASPTWDAVGVLTHLDIREWILVEAKAHTAELRSTGCAAKEPSRTQIAGAFEEVQRDQGAVAAEDWMGRFYQYCNRLATLWFLLQHGVDARFVHLFFCGDERSVEGRTSSRPADAAGWTKAIDAMETAVGLPLDAPLRRFVHHVFLNVNAEA